jgi:hypothetical protein
MPQKNPIQPSRLEIEAFSHACPSSEEVTHLLSTLGLRFTFQMPASTRKPLVAAQFHYESPCGTQVIYLAGRDHDLDHVGLPPHASRWWLISGHDPALTYRVRDALASTWHLFQHAPDQPLLQTLKWSA